MIAHAANFAGQLFHVPRQGDIDQGGKAVLFGNGTDGIVAGRIGALWRFGGRIKIERQLVHFGARQPYVEVGSARDPLGQIAPEPHASRIGQRAHVGGE